MVARIQDKEEKGTRNWKIKFTGEKSSWETKTLKHQFVSLGTWSAVRVGLLVHCRFLLSKHSLMMPTQRPLVLSDNSPLLPPELVTVSTNYCHLLLLATILP